MSGLKQLYFTVQVFIPVAVSLFVTLHSSFHSVTLIYSSEIKKTFIYLLCQIWLCICRGNPGLIYSTKPHSFTTATILLKPLWEFLWVEKKSFQICWISMTVWGFSVAWHQELKLLVLLKCSVAAFGWAEILSFSQTVWWMLCVWDSPVYSKQ